MGTGQSGVSLRNNEKEEEKKEKNREQTNQQLENEKIKHRRRRRKKERKRERMKLFSSLSRSRDRTTLFNSVYVISVMRSSFDYSVKSSLDLVLDSPSSSPRPVCHDSIVTFVVNPTFE